MFLLETKHFRNIIDEYKTLFVSSKGCIIQKVCDLDIIMYEWHIPLLWCDKREIELVISIDEEILRIFKTYETIWIDKEVITGLPGDTYRFHATEISSWETFFPDEACVMFVPQINCIPDDIVDVHINHEGFKISWGRFTRVFPVLKIFNNVKTSIYGKQLKEVFERHINKCAIVFAQEEYPFCLEFSHGEKIFIAPCPNLQ
jgi:hypothetical protein